MTFDNVQLGADLRRVCGPNGRGVRLPSRSLLQFSGSQARVTILVTERATKQNMQTDGGAFEAWCLILKAWLGIERFELDAEVPHGMTPAEKGHYERFLYRLQRCRDVFPDWFEVAPRLLGHSRALTGASGSMANPLAPKLLNVRRTQSEELSANDRRVPIDELSERKLAKRLLEALREGFALESIDEQLSVGLFDGKVTKANAIFSGGGSAIDLVGIHAKTLWICELKRRGNPKAGILSELLFYTHVMRDTMKENPPFTFSTKPSACKVQPSHIAQCEVIEAVMLSREYHPLVEHPSLLSLLNGGHWHSSGQRVPVSFRTHAISDQGHDRFTFPSLFPITQEEA